MEKIEIIEKRCIEEMEMDYVPLNDIVREFSGFERLIPLENEFFQSLEFLEYLINKYNIQYYEAPGDIRISKSSNELIKWLKQKWHSGQYDQIAYGVWFEKC